MLSVSQAVDPDEMQATDSSSHDALESDDNTVAMDQLITVSMRRCFEMKTLTSRSRHIMLSHRPHPLINQTPIALHKLLLNNARTYGDHQMSRVCLRHLVRPFRATACLVP